MKRTILSLCFLLVTAIVYAQRIKPDVVNTAAGSLTIQPIEHASLVLQASGKTIYIDPVGGAGKYQGLAAPDLILVTDIHGDHFDPATLTAIRTPNTILVVPAAVAEKLPEADKKGVVIMKNGDQQTEAGFAITTLPMYNLPESPTAMHTKGRGNGYVLTIGKKQVYISGDTQGIPEMRSLKNIDIAFVCMNLPYTMDVPEAADAVLAFKPKIVYPYHYRGKNGLSDVNQFKKLVDAGNKHIDVRLRDWYAK
ncbi:MBL fold metallo-hydrolase [Chitinophaga eiseniae]|uniref:MBL fold metallo-hydrolase n=1 Tax=Chitinophaga eiseniae TaxID=634771 RepID=A0A847SU83_9BACT|nr:MBL fold metallo-hydrolase [Chitinophaga eiseniae]NLR81386.1 MBL fold metallo-hydrolase [Chitinophaga eiseniae]